MRRWRPRAIHVPVATRQEARGSPDERAILHPPASSRPPKPVGANPLDTKVAGDLESRLHIPGLHPQRARGAGNAKGNGTLARGADRESWGRNFMRSRGAVLLSSTMSALAVATVAAATVSGWAVSRAYAAEADEEFREGVKAFD